jgi:hypothetical protein
MHPASRGPDSLLTRVAHVGVMFTASLALTGAVLAIVIPYCC